MRGRRLHVHLEAAKTQIKLLNPRGDFQYSCVVGTYDTCDTFMMTFHFQSVYRRDCCGSYSIYYYRVQLLR